MSFTEYDHCRNCLYLSGDSVCNKHNTRTSVKNWCEKHIRKDPLDVNDMAVECEYRTTHAIAEAQGREVKPIEDVLYKNGWDGIERLKNQKR